MAIPAPRDGDIEIRFEPSHRSVRVKVGTTLLEAVQLAQLPIASACGADGVCARCGLEILVGAADLPGETAREREIKLRNRVDPKLRLACRVTIASSITATAPYCEKTVSDPLPAILLVDHGSRRAEANEQLEEIARRIRAREPDRIVVAAHMEIAEPSIDAAIDACVAAGARAIVVHPYLLAPGRHSTRDIPDLAAKAARRHVGVTVRVSEPLGVHEKLVDIVLERVADAAPRK